MTDQIRGFSIPFRIDPYTGGVAQASGPEKLKENIIHILLTRVGERVMRRRYGGGLQQLLHDPNDDVLRALVQRQIAESLGQFEPQILVRQIDVTQRDGTLWAELHYVVRRTQQVEELTVPLTTSIS